MARLKNCKRCNKPKRPKGKKFRELPGYCECGRPTVINEKTIEKLEAAFMIALSDVKACAYAGIDGKTLWNYEQKNPKFIHRKQQLKQMLSIRAQQTIAKAIEINSGDAWKYLEKTDPDFIPRSKIEHTVETIENTDEQSPEEKAALIALREARRKRIENKSKEK